MLIGKVHRQIEGPPEGIVSSLEEIWSHGRARNKILLQGVVQKPNIVLWQQQIMRCQGNETNM
jgi:hypothetical protein